MIAKIFLILLLLPAAKIPAQSILSNGGARNEALAAQSAVTVDEWALWRNPAGIVYPEVSTIAIGARYTPIISIPARSAVLALKTRFGCIGSGVSAFGDELYNEQVLSVAFAHKLGPTSLGIRTDVFQLTIDGNGIKRSVGITVGGITAIGRRVMIGGVARNVNLPQWVKGHPLPVVLAAGILFIPTENFSVMAEVEKNTSFEPTIKSGVEYSLRKKFFVRTGFNLFPDAAFGGFGFRVWRLGVDYALRWGYLPGYLQQLSISIRLRNHDK